MIHPLGPPYLSDSSIFVPKTDMVENELYVLTTVEVPGVEDENLSVSITNHTLTIRGYKPNEFLKQGSFYRLERAYGPFERVLSLPCEVNSDDAVAELRDGLLTIVLPKSAQSQVNEKMTTIKINESS